MNVAFDPWIPVLTATGQRDTVSLIDVFVKGDQIVDLSVRPHERVALMRLFLCVAHAALDGPKDYEAWCAVPEKMPVASLRYLNEWRNAFELFDAEKPWLQVKGLSKSSTGQLSLTDTSDWSPVSKLNFSYASGNTATLFDHGGMNHSRKIAVEETIVSMLAYQCFSPGGLISQVFWNSNQTGKSSKDGPCVPASMIHGLIRGRTMREAIHLNLPCYEDIKLIYGDQNIGKPIWEMVPTSFSHISHSENATKTYVGRLVPMTRLIFLHVSGQKMLLGDGLVYPPFSDGFPQEPTATVILRNAERALLSFRPAKAVWRELPALIAKRSADGTGGPLALRALRDGDGCDLIAVALARDQANIVDTSESVFYIPANMRTGEGCQLYEAEAQRAEKIAIKLGLAIEEYRKGIDQGWEGRLKSAGAAKNDLRNKLTTIATQQYWTTVEKNLSLLMSCIETLGTDQSEPAFKLWHNMLFTASCESYRTACGTETPRQLRAFAMGWKKLTMQKQESIDDTETPAIEEEEKS